MNNKKEIQKLEGSFETIFCLEVSEYLWNPLVALKNMYFLLKPGGVLYMSFCTNYPLHNPPGIDYLRYSKNAIEKYLKEVGFKSWEITPRVATEGAGALSDFYSRERMRPMKYAKEIFDLGYMCRAVK